MKVFQVGESGGYSLSPKKIAQLRCLSERTSNRTFPAARGFEKFSF
jgi:hypothetical protein